jgi:hypothetical protein
MSLPSGFPMGGVGGGGVGLDQAYSGQSLQGGENNMDERFNPRKRDHKFQPGLPSGLGARPPMSSGMNTSW